MNINVQPNGEASVIFQVEDTFMDSDCKFDVAHWLISSYSIEGNWKSEIEDIILGLDSAEVLLRAMNLHGIPPKVDLWLKEGRLMGFESPTGKILPHEFFTAEEAHAYLEVYTLMLSLINKENN